MASGKKKWLVVLRIDQYTWMKETAQKTGLKGSDILGEILDRVINDPKSDFLSSLAETQLKIKLQQLNDKAAALEEEREKLRRQYKHIGDGNVKEKALA